MGGRFTSLKDTKEGSILALIGESSNEGGNAVNETTDDPTRTDEAGKKAGAMTKSGKPAKKPGKKSSADLAKMRKQAKRREGKAKDPKRAASMKSVWKSKRAQMLKGWKNRKKLYGPSGRRAAESLAKILGILDSYRGKEDTPELSGDHYAEMQESIAGYLTAVMADEKVTDAEVYEAILFNVSPIMAIVEAVAENKGVFQEADLANMEDYADYLEKEELSEEEPANEQEDDPEGEEPEGEDPEGEDPEGDPDPEGDDPEGGEDPEGD